MKVFILLLILILVPSVIASTTFFDNQDDVFIMGTPPITQETQPASGGSGYVSSIIENIGGQPLLGTSFSFVSILVVLSGVVVFIWIWTLIRKEQERKQKVRVREMEEQKINKPQRLKDLWPYLYNIFVRPLKRGENYGDR